MYALAPPAVVAVGASRSRCQKWLSCQGILRNSLHRPRPDPAAQTNDGVARSERKSLQVNGIQGHLEQSGRVGGFGRFHMVAG